MPKMTLCHYIHGTSVASVLGGNTVGVARGVTIVPVKVASCYDDGKQTKLSMLATARGLDWILQDYDDIRTNGYNPNYNPSQRAVVNISLRYRLSSHGSYTCEDDAGGYVNCLSAIEHEILTLIQNDIPVVVSAGNDGHDVSNDGMSRMGYGGSFSTHHTITVGGTEYSANGDERWVCNQGDFASPFSCTGNAGSNIGAAVSIWAPAWNVKAAGGFTEDDFRPGTNHGTSFAAPLVTGAIARILEKYPSKSAEDIWDYLWSSATGPAYIGDLDSSVTCPQTPHPETDKYCEERLLYISAYD
jgi:subtilisin family serine protease